MFLLTSETRRRDFMSGYRPVFVAVVLLLLAPVALAQNSFSSGSTGADGAFAPTTTQTIVVPDSGVFNFTTVNIPAGVTITFNRATNNKPLTILASGDVVIAGTINLDGKQGTINSTAGLGGPGGGTGGTGGYGFDQSHSGTPGDGSGAGGGGIGSSAITTPGGGGGGGFGLAGATGGAGATAGQPGPKVGTVTILPLTGGSGGGGGAAANGGRGGGGGGGGGGILIASSGTITINGAIQARGGAGNSGHAGGGGGSGGAIRLIANTINGTTGNLNVSGGGGGGATVSFSGGVGGQGYIRIEAYDFNGFTGTTTPSTIASLTFPHPITPPNLPSLRIASVAGVNAPATPVGSLQAVPDVIVPASTSNPVTVALEGTNLPVGTVLQVTLAPARGARTTVSSSPLAGTESASTASANVTLPTGMSVISATGIIDLTIAKADPIFIQGERVRRIEVAAVFGGPSELTYITASGRRIKQPTN